MKLFKSLCFFLNLSFAPAAAPSIVTPPLPKLAGFLGDNLDISCEASGTPTPAYFWSINGDQFNEVEGGNLFIDSLEPTDSGTYTCLATNDIGSSATASTEVLVIGKQQMQ